MKPKIVRVVGSSGLEYEVRTRALTDRQREIRMSKTPPESVASLDRYVAIYKGDVGYGFTREEAADEAITRADSPNDEWGFALAQIYEAIWIVGKTGKPIATVGMETEAADQLQGYAAENCRRQGVQMARIHQSDDPEVVSEVLVFYRESTMLSVWRFLNSEWALDNIPMDVLSALQGLMYGYRTEAIHTFVEAEAEALGELPLHKED